MRGGEIYIWDGKVGGANFRVHLFLLEGEEAATFWLVFLL